MPTAPWSPGEHPDYSAFVIEVHVRKDRSGKVQSFRRLQSEQDEKVVQGFSSSGGMEEGAWALMVESVRTEALLQTLIKMSNDLDFKKNLLAAQAPSEELIEKLTAATMNVGRRVLDSIVSSLVEETLRTITHELRRELQAE